MKKNLLPLLLISILTFGLTGCPRYDTVRSLSTEQLNDQKEFKKSLERYFAVMNGFMAAQKKVTDYRLDQITAQIQQKYQRIADLKLAVDPPPTAAQRQQILKELADNVRAESAVNEQARQKIDGLIKQVKDKQDEIVASYNSMLAAQEQLDKYIQLKKFDEVLFQETVGALKLNEQKITKGFDTVGNLLGQITDEANKLTSTGAVAAQPTPAT